MIKTSCRNCKFAQYNDNKQFGCTKKRLDTFKSYGVNVSELAKDGITSYIIDDLCNYCFDKTSYDNTKDADIRFTQMTQFQTDWVIVNNTNSDYLSVFNSCMLSIHRAIYENIKPRSVNIVISNNKNIPPENRYLMYNSLNSILKTSGIILNITYMAKEHVEYWECVNSIFYLIKAGYYTVFEAGYNIPYNFNASLDKELNVKLRNFKMFTGLDDKNGVTFNVESAKEYDNHNNGLLQLKINKQYENTEQIVKYRAILEKEGVFFELT